MTPYLFEVTVTLNNAADRDAWVRWMVDEHIPRVLAAGTRSATFVELAEPPLTFVASYVYESQSAFERFAATAQPALREHTLQTWAPPRAQFAARAGCVLLDRG